MLQTSNIGLSPAHKGISQEEDCPLKPNLSKGKGHVAETDNLVAPQRGQPKSGDEGHDQRRNGKHLGQAR